MPDKLTTTRGKTPINWPMTLFMLTGCRNISGSSDQL